MALVLLVLDQRCLVLWQQVGVHVFDTGRSCHVRCRGGVVPGQQVHRPGGEATHVGHGPGGLGSYSVGQGDPAPYLSVDADEDLCARRAVGFGRGPFDADLGPVHGRAHPDPGQGGEVLH